MVATAVDFIAYLLFRLLWALGEITPLPRLRGFLEGLCRLALRVDRRHRQVIYDNLGIAFPDYSRARVEATAGQAFANWGRIAAELMHAEQMFEETDRDAFERLRQTIEELGRQGCGVLGLTAHMANFELLGRLCGRSGIRLAVFNRPMKNRWVAGFLQRQRATSGHQELGRGIEVRRALEGLGQGRLVVAPLDQNQAAGRGIFVDMFGRAASTSTLLARLSVASGAPVLPIFAAWQGDRLVPVVGRPIWPAAAASAPTPAPGPGRKASIQALTALYTAEIEAMVRRFPEQWNWAHRRWKTRPPTESDQQE